MENINQKKNKQKTSIKKRVLHDGTIEITRYAYDWEYKSRDPENIYDEEIREDYREKMNSQFSHDQKKRKEMNRNPKRGEIWSNGTYYCYIFMIAKDMGTDKERVVFQTLTNDEEMVIHSQEGEILSIKIREPYSLDLKIFKELNQMKLFKEAPKKSKS